MWRVWILEGEIVTFVAGQEHWPPCVILFADAVTQGGTMMMITIFLKSIPFFEACRISPANGHFQN